MLQETMRCIFDVYSLDLKCFMLQLQLFTLWMLLKLGPSLTPVLCRSKVNRECRKLLKWTAHKSSAQLTLLDLTCLEHGAKSEGEHAELPHLTSHGLETLEIVACTNQEHQEQTINIQSNAFIPRESAFLLLISDVTILLSSVLVGNPYSAWSLAIHTFLHVPTGNFPR